MAYNRSRTLLFRPGPSLFLLRNLCGIPYPSVRDFSFPALKYVTTTTLNTHIPHAVLGDFRYRNQKNLDMVHPK